MDEMLLSRIRQCAVSEPRGIPFPPASERSLDEAEHALGFAIPSELKLLYLQVGNGGFGPGRGGTIVGVSGGYRSDYGYLVETHNQLKVDHESEGKQWKAGLLPFCEWGCAIFSCVDSNDPSHNIYLYEGSEITSQHYTLREFFELWVKGEEILSYREAVYEKKEIINPFTGQKSLMARRQGTGREEGEGTGKR